MTETGRFAKTFDTFFDCLNVRSPDEHILRRKPNLSPYTQVDDVRFTVCFIIIMCFNGMLHF